MDIQRARGLMLGLAAGDKVRCPFKMSLCILEALVENGTQYDPALTLVNYLNWYRSRDIGWEDCGPTTTKVFDRFLQEDFANTPSSETPLDPEKVRNVDPVLLYRHASAVDLECGGMTAGVHAAHRASVLGLLGFGWPPEVVWAAAASDVNLTHISATCRHTCVCVALICTHLLAGRSWLQSVQLAAEQVSACFPVQNALIEGQDIACRPHLSRGGYCVDVLKAAVHFMTHCNSFESALTASIQFAGPANYAPVLVGAFAGALYGADAVPAAHLRQWERAELTRTDRLLCSMAAMFDKLKRPGYGGMRDSVFVNNNNTTTSSSTASPTSPAHRSFTEEQRRLRDHSSSSSDGMSRCGPSASTASRNLEHQTS